jgi:hypothetical protein
LNEKNLQQKRSVVRESFKKWTFPRFCLKNLTHRSTDFSWQCTSRFFRTSCTTNFAKRGA